MEAIIPVVIFAAFIVYEALRPARKLQRVTWWQLKGLVFFLVAGVITTVIPFALADVAAKVALLDLSGLGTLAGAAVGYVVFQLAAYWWHRALHTSPLLWRWAHQMHHSAERIDVWGAFLFHPFDLAAFTVLPIAVFSLLGLSPGAAALAGIYGLFASVFQHANIRTPRWLGYIMQRPEGHGVHHQRGVHAYNYSDLPLWDIVFGTFRNPAVWMEQGGFYDGGSKRTGAILLGRDITTPESNPMSSRPALVSTSQRAAA
jgi:sterol desaturase/sphingolipid hydroxylase (fatty acid hydroxylase superfamily)